MLAAMEARLLLGWTGVSPLDVVLCSSLASMRGGTVASERLLESTWWGDTGWGVSELSAWNLTIVDLLTSCSRTADTV